MSPMNAWTSCCAGEYFKTFAPLAVALEQLGWRRDADLLAHLYDWR